MKIGVVKFPGASGADDVIYAYQAILGHEAFAVSHEEETVGNPDALIVPGGFSYGDYLRPGGLAKGSLVAGAIRKYAQDGGPVLGIGNGFQILCELGVLPGGFVMNRGARFINKDVDVVVESSKSPFTKGIQQFKVLRLPIACHYGCYYADKRTMRDIENAGHIALRFCNSEGEVDPTTNVTGSLGSIAGVISRHENVLGIIVHPERAVEAALGGLDGLEILKSVIP